MLGLLTSLQVHLFQVKQSFARVNMTIADGKHPTHAQARAAQKWQRLVKRDARRTARLVQRIWHDARKVNALPEHVISRLKGMGLQHERMASSDDNTLLIWRSSSSTRFHVLLKAKWARLWRVAQQPCRPRTALLFPRVRRHHLLKNIFHAEGCY
jgi:hypothetical protein